MAYRVSRRSSFDKDAKGHRNQKNEIKAAIDEILKNPACGDSLKYNWKGFISYHFHRKPEMRIFYAVYPCCSTLAGYISPSCRFEVEMEEEDESETCQGLIEFVRLLTREECNNIYNLHKKYVPDLLE